MRKFVMSLVVAALFSAGLGLGLRTSSATGLCWGYCDNGVRVKCCPGVGCWVTGPC